MDKSKWLMSDLFTLPLGYFLIATASALCHMSPLPQQKRETKVFLFRALVACCLVGKLVFLARRRLTWHANKKCAGVDCITTSRKLLLRSFINIFSHKTSDANNLDAFLAQSFWFISFVPVCWLKYFYLVFAQAWVASCAQVILNLNPQISFLSFKQVFDLTPAVEASIKR